MNTPEGKYIIYVEDDPDDIAFFFDYFGHLDHLSTLVFNNGAELLNYLNGLRAEQLPCLIVLDINTPVMNGWTTVDHLKSNEKYKELPVVMFSTSSLDLEKEKSKKYGVEVVTKPFNIQEADGIAEKLLSYCTAEI